MSGSRKLGSDPAETYSVIHNTNHRWFYFPEMAADEVPLLKCYDLAAGSRRRFGSHRRSAIPQRPRPRGSIELRTLVFQADG